MPLIGKQPINTVWAERGDTIAPSTLKVARGWIVEIPPHQQMNWWMKRSDEFLAHINQRGVPSWDATTQYYANLSYVVGLTTGTIYVAVQDSLGRNPESTTGFWEQAFMRRSQGYTKAEIDAFRTQDRNYADQTFLRVDANLADVPNKAQARQNLGITSDAENSGRFLQVANNLSDVPNKATARGNLDIFSKGEADGRFVAISKNLSDLPNKAAARSNLGLGNSAIANVGQQAGQVAAGDDPRIVNAVQNSRQIIAGDGLVGGGALGGDVILHMGTPGTISLGSSNSNSADSHSHYLDVNSLFQSSLAENGWIRLPNGLILQWMRGAAMISNGQTYTFPRQFPTACFNVQVTSQGQTVGNTDTSQNEMTITSVTTSGVTLTRFHYPGDMNARPVPHIFAIGI